MFVIVAPYRQVNDLRQYFESTAENRLPPKPMIMKYHSPDLAISDLTQQLNQVRVSESSNLDRDSFGRLLGESVIADRDSPAADISAMDGYAINQLDLQTKTPIPIQGESKAGNPPPSLSRGSTVRIFTGAIVPSEADTVIRREDTEETDSTILIKGQNSSYPIGSNIRVAGENANKGSVAIKEGQSITGASAATIANFGYRSIRVLKRLRVAIVTTGDEVGSFDSSDPQPWQIRNSNLNSLSVFLNAFPWLEVSKETHCVDRPKAISAAISEALQNADALLMTGGVSMGNYDYVPEQVKEIGANIVFHGLPIRPGKPILGAASISGKFILGLPGNPVSALVGCYRIGLPVLRYMAGFSDWEQKPPSTLIAETDNKTLSMYWYRLVKESINGTIQLCPTKGSGDLVSLGQSTGFIEIPPDQCGAGPWTYYKWC